MLMCWYGSGAHEYVITTPSFRSDQLVHRRRQTVSPRIINQSSGTAGAWVTCQPASCVCVDGICSTNIWENCEAGAVLTWPTEPNIKSPLGRSGKRQRVRMGYSVVAVIAKREAAPQCAASPKWSWSDGTIGVAWRSLGGSSRRMFWVFAGVCVRKDGEAQKQSVGGSVCMY